MASSPSEAAVTAYPARLSMMLKTSRKPCSSSTTKIFSTVSFLHATTAHRSLRNAADIPQTALLVLTSLSTLIHPPCKSTMRWTCGQPQPRTFFFRRKKRKKDFVEILFRNAFPRVLKRNFDDIGAAPADIDLSASPS